MVLIRGLGMIFGCGVFVLVSKKISSIFDVHVVSYDVLCVGHGQMYCS